VRLAFVDVQVIPERRKDAQSILGGQQPVDVVVDAHVLRAETDQAVGRGEHSGATIIVNANGEVQVDLIVCVINVFGGIGE